MRKKYLKDRTTVKTHNLVKVTNITSGNFKTLWLLSVRFVQDTSEEKSSSPIIINTSEESSIAANQPGKRGRRKVLKSKQYVDEEGFMGMQ